MPNYFAITKGEGQQYDQFLWEEFWFDLENKAVKMCNGIVSSFVFGWATKVSRVIFQVVALSRKLLFLRE